MKVGFDTSSEISIFSSYISLKSDVRMTSTTAAEGKRFY
jgi:hypothetical protein